MPGHSEARGHQLHGPELDTRFVQCHAGGGRNAVKSDGRAVATLHLLFELNRCLDLRQKGNNEEDKTGIVDNDPAFL